VKFDIVTYSLIALIIILLLLIIFNRKKCPHCGAKNSRLKKTCKKCGHPLKSDKREHHKHVDKEAQEKK